MTAPAWLIDLLDGISLWDALAWLTACIGAIWFIRKKGWRSVVAIARAIVDSAKILEAVQGLPAWQERIEVKVDGIHHETHKNDGSSVKDAVDRIEKSLNLEVLPALTKLSQSDDELWAALDDTQTPEGES